MPRPLCCMLAIAVAIAAHAHAADVPPLKPVEVITDPAQIEAAKTVQTAVDASGQREVGWAIRGLLSSDAPSIRTFEQHREAAIPRLKKVVELAGDTPVPASLMASHFLHALGEPGHEAQIATSLDSDLLAMRRMGLQLLLVADDPDTPLPDDIAARVLALMDDRSPSIRAIAANVAGTRNIPGFGGRLESAVRAGRIAAEDMAHWLAQHSDDPAMFDLVAETAFTDAIKRLDGGESYVFPVTLTVFMGSPNANVAEHARTRLRRMVRGLKPEHRRSFGFSSLLETVATREDADLLRDVLNHAELDESRAAALRGLARVQPKEATSLAFKEFARLPDAAAIILAEHATQADGAKIVEAIDALTSGEWSVTMVDLLMDKGGEAGQRALRERLPGLDPHVQHAARWRLEGLSLAGAIRDFHAAGIITISPDELLRPTDAGSNATDDDDFLAPMSLEDALEQAGVLMWWDAEAGQAPVRHDHLLTAMAEASNDYFRPRHASEKWLQRDADDTAAAYRVQFIHHDKLFRVEARSFGDWYDAEAVVAAANVAITHTGRPERFIPLNGGDQYLMLVFADPGTLAPLAEKYGLQIDATADGARQRGVQFQAKVMESMDIKELEP